MQSFLVILTVINLGFFLSVAYLILRRKHKTKSQVRFLLVIIFAFLWILDSFLQGFEVFNSNKLLTHINFSVAALVAGAMVSFAFHFPDENSKKLREFWIWIPAVALSILSYTQLFVRPISFREIEKAPLYPLYIAIVATYFLPLTLTLLVRKYKKVSNIQKMQIRYFLAAYSVAILAQLGESIYINTIRGLSVVADRVIYNISLFFIGGAAYSILRYRFLDLRLFIQRNTVKALSFVVVYVVYLLVILSVVRPTLIEQRSITPATYMLIGLLVVITIEPLRKYVSTAVDRLFAQHDTKVEKVKQRLQVQLRSQQAYNGLIKEIYNALQQVAGVTSVAFIDASSPFRRDHPATWEYARMNGKVLVPEEFQYRVDEDERFSTLQHEFLHDTTSVIIPVGQAESFVGCFILGTRQNKGAYTIDDVRALTDLQQQFSSALLSARLYKQAVERIM